METDPTLEDDDELVAEEELRPTTTGLYCFLSAERVCGAECMAFVTYPKKSENSELGQQQAHCVLLNNADRIGRNFVIAVSVMAQAEKKKRNVEADKARASQFEPKPASVPREADKSPFGDKK